MHVMVQKRAASVVVFVLISVWMFSGWPRIWQTPDFPPRIPDALASAAFVAANGTAGSLSTTVDIGTADTDRVVAVFAGSEADSTKALSGVTVDGKACTWVATAQNTNGLGNRTELWYCDDDQLGSSNGTVTVAITGTSLIAANWAVHAIVYSGVDQSGPNDSGIDNTSITPATTASIPNIDVAAGGIVVMGAHNGTQALTATYTSPLTQRTTSDPGSADGVTASGVESSAQTNKTYTVTWSAAPNRSSAVAASWDEAVSNLPPNAPALSNVPFDNEKTGDSTPTFQFTANDPDGSADITYEIAIDDDYAFGSVLVSCASDTSCATGSGSFSRSGDSDPFTEGQEVTFTPSTAMSTGVTYYWRVRAKDASGSGGSGGYGSWSVIHSVAYVSGTDPSAWTQTMDEQFTMGTLTNTEATSDAIQLSGGGGGSLNVLLLCATSGCTDANADVPLHRYVTSTLGYSVTPHDATQTSTAGYDVVLISESITSGAVAWMKAEAKPLVTLEGSNWDEFDFGTGGASNGTADTDWEIVDNTHYITQEYSTGDLTVSASTADNGSNTGWSNDVQALAVSANTPTQGRILVVENGGTLVDSTTAAERRVFFAARYFDPLNAAGENLFTRALDWAAYNTSVASGTIMSPEIDFDWVSGQASWDEVNFSTTETNGDIKLHIYYTASTPCDTIVPDAALSGNASGFDVSGGAIDLSGLNTTTYNRICLQAVLTDSGGSPTLNDWTVSWAAASGALSVEIVDGAGSPVGSPSMTMTPIGISLTNQTATGTLGVSAERIRISNDTAGPQWTLTIAASSTTSFWDGSTSDYDFNDPTSGAGDGGDADALGGQMTMDPSGASITPQGGCSGTGLTLGGSSSFSEGATDFVTLLSAGSGADTSCYWDLTDIDIAQTIPASQAGGAYSIDMILTITAV